MDTPAATRLQLAAAQRSADTKVPFGWPSDRQRPQDASRKGPGSGLHPGEALSGKAGLRIALILSARKVAAQIRAMDWARSFPIFRREVSELGARAIEAHLDLGVSSLGSLAGFEVVAVRVLPIVLGGVGIANEGVALGHAPPDPDHMPECFQVG